MIPVSTTSATGAMSAVASPATSQPAQRIERFQPYQARVAGARHTPEASHKRACPAIAARAALAAPTP